MRGGGVRHYIEDALAFVLRLNIHGSALPDDDLPGKFAMYFRFIIPLIAVLTASIIFAQGTNQPTVDELVAKNIEAKGGATALNNLQTLRATGKLLVPVQGQIELAYLETKKRPDEVRTEASLQGMTQIEAYDGKEGWRISPFFGRDARRVQVFPATHAGFTLFLVQLIRDTLYWGEMCAGRGSAPRTRRAGG